MSGNLVVTAGAIAAATGSGTGNKIGSSGTGQVQVPFVVTTNGGVTGPFSEAFLLANTGSLTTIASVIANSGNVNAPTAVATAGSGTTTTPGTAGAAGTFALTATNVYTGGTTIGSGIVQIGANQALGLPGSAVKTTVVGGASLVIPSAGASALTVTTPLTLNGFGVASQGALVSNSNSNTWSGTIALSSPSSIGVGSGSTLTVTGIISGGTLVTALDDLNKVGAGTFAANGANTYIGQTIISGGTFTAGNGTATGNAANVTTLNPGTTLNIATATTVGGLVMNGNATVSGTTLTLGGNLRTTGTGNVISAPLNVVAQRVFSIASGGGGPVAGTTTTSGPTTGNELSLSGAVTNSSVLIKEGDGTLVYSGATADAGTGTTVLAEGPMTFNKTAAAIAGPLIIGNFSNHLATPDVLTILGTTNQLNSQAVTINSSGTLDMHTAGTNAVGALTLNGGTLIGPVTSGSTVNQLTLTGNVTATSASTPTGIISSTISGNVQLSTTATSRVFTVGDGFQPATAATAVATFSGGVTSVSPADIQGGLNYITPPVVTITSSDGVGSGATATATIVGGIVTAITVTKQASPNFDATPIITIAAPTPLASLTATGVATLTGTTVTGITLEHPGGGYSAATTPTDVISRGGGSGAVATATIDPTTGAVTGFKVSSPGSSYTSVPTVMVVPFLPVAATATVALGTGGTLGTVTITNPGAGYLNTTSGPTVRVIGGGGTATAKATVSAAGLVTAITFTGAAGFTSVPIIEIDPPDLTATATAILAGNGTITGLTPTNAGGAGYTVAPTVTITGGGGSGATATAALNANGPGTVTFTMTSPGSGYTSQPTVTIAPPFAAFPATITQATAVSSLNSNGGVGAVTVTYGGSGYSTTPVVTLSGGGGGTGATAVAQVNGTGAVIGVVVTNPGTGYTAAPTITIAAPSNVATATATVSNGVVTGFTLTNAGTDYYTTPLVTISGGGGTNATATAQVSNGVVTGLLLNNPGSGYTSAPTVTFAAPFSTAPSLTVTQATAAAAVNAGVVTVTMTNIGGGYTSVPQVTLVGGGGTYTSATATILNGTVTGITVVGSSGYTSAPTVVIDVPQGIPLANVPGLIMTGLLSGGTSSISVGLTKSGPGRLDLNGVTTNTYTGNTVVSEGTLYLANQNSTTANSSTPIPVGTTLQVGDATGGPGADVVRLLGSNEIPTTDEVLIFDSGLLDFNTASTTGSDGGNNNTVGQLVLVGGLISLPGTSTLTLSTDLTSNGSSFPAQITGTGNLNLGGVARNFNVGLSTNPTPTTPDLVVGVPITNDGGNGITKIGAGTAVFNFASPGVSGFYTGPTTVSQGTLLVNGSMPSSAFVVNNGGTLGGVGTVGAITVNSGGTVSPGDTPGFLPAPNDQGDGILNAASANFSAGGNLAILAQSNATPGVTYSRLAVAGALTLGGTSTITGNLAGVTGAAAFPGVVTYGTLSPANGTFTTANFPTVPSGDEAAANYVAAPNSVSIVVGSATVTVSFNPSTVTAGQAVTAIATPPLSPSGGPVTLSYVWTLNNTVIRQTMNSSLLSDTLPATANLTRGQVITVTVTPFDVNGNTTGAPATATTTVADSPPVATVSLSPPNPSVTSTLTATATTADADGDPVSLNYIWTKNGSSVPIGSDRR